jgi:hypothetical protein
LFQAENTHPMLRDDSQGSETVIGCQALRRQEPSPRNPERSTQLSPPFSERNTWFGASIEDDEPVSFSGVTHSNRRDHRVVDARSDWFPIPAAVAASEQTGARSSAVHLGRSAQVDRNTSGRQFQSTEKELLDHNWTIILSIDRLRLLRPVKFKDSVVSMKANPSSQPDSASLLLDCP